MTDYDWMSKETVQVATEGLREEAKKWYGLSDRMVGVSQQASAQSLEASAFAVTDLTGPITTVDLKAGYDKMYDWLNALFKQAVTEFATFGDALVKCADAYESSDGRVAQDFDSIAKQQ
ncbi:MAG TPA: hypothetical protein VGQ92_20355 [Actinoplanes sp.]|jgi:hypothetical protein|nr:hypothetical protein [Actinoplanes sp.]